MTTKVGAFGKTKPKVPPKPESAAYSKGSKKSMHNTNKNATVTTGKSESGAKSTGDKRRNGRNKNQNGEDTVTEQKWKILETRISAGDLKKVGSSGALSDIASASAVVSSTTTTATQPLKINTDIASILKNEIEVKNSSASSPSEVSGATSLSNAVNKMSDTAVTSQALPNEHNVSKLSPAANAIISMSSKRGGSTDRHGVGSSDSGAVGGVGIANSDANRNDTHDVSGAENGGNAISGTESSGSRNGGTINALNSTGNQSKRTSVGTGSIVGSDITDKTNKAFDTKNATTALPTIESIHKKLDDIGQNMNSAFVEPNKVHMESIDTTVKNNINKVLTPDHNYVLQKSANERIREARTVVAADVKPIKILVKEKPTDVEVQSGNVRFPMSTTNGLNVAPG